MKSQSNAFEFVVSVLKRSGIELDRKQLRKLSKELYVKLRKRPLAWKQIWDDMKKRSKEKIHKKNDK